MVWSKFNFNPLEVVDFGHKYFENSEYYQDLN